MKLTSQKTFKNHKKIGVTVIVHSLRNMFKSNNQVQKCLAFYRIKHLFSGDKAAKVDGKAIVLGSVLNRIVMSRYRSGFKALRANTAGIEFGPDKLRRLSEIMNRRISLVGVVEGESFQENFTLTS